MGFADALHLSLRLLSCRQSCRLALLLLMLFDNATDQDGSCRFCEVVIDLACAGILMATTAEFQHQLADICVIVTVEDRLADGEYRVLISETVHDMH